MKAVTSNIMQKIDRETINSCGIPGIVLMENAGRGAVDTIFRYFQNIESISVIAGKGNNGGDGFVIARHMVNRGVRASVYLLSEIEKIRGDAQINLDIIKKMGIPVISILNIDELLKEKENINKSSIVIDAIFGTGLSYEVKGFYREVIDFINSLNKTVVSVDIPSGLDANTGYPLGISMHADLTVTFGLPKIGQLIYPGAELVGKLEIVDISIPKYIIEKEYIDTNLITYEDIKKKIKKRAPNIHKGNCGHTIVIAGSTGKTGAAVMASESAMRVGAGLVTLCIPKSSYNIVESKLTEVMTEPLPDNNDGTFNYSSIDRIIDLTNDKDIVIIGPGLSVNGDTKRIVGEVIKSIDLPIVIDADGINIIAENPDILLKKKNEIVLTPHPGEMARLIKKDTRAVQRDRIGIAKEFGKKYGVYLVLKGARTIIADPQSNVYINPTGNPGMASGGMGDVLTGMIGGFISQGYNILDSSILGVFIHGMSGDRVAEEKGELGLVATDVINNIPLTIKELMDGNRDYLKRSKRDY
jgi:NAD(P)H-hydrate epimerase